MLTQTFCFLVFFVCVGRGPGSSLSFTCSPLHPSPVCSILSVKTRFCTEPATCSSLSMRRIEHKYKLFYLSNSFLLFCVIIFFLSICLSLSQQIQSAIQYTYVSKYRVIYLKPHIREQPAPHKHKLDKSEIQTRQRGQHDAHCRLVQMYIIELLNPNCASGAVRREQRCSG